MKRYICNCFLLTVPILVWNSLLAGKLPQAFTQEVSGSDIPSIIIIGENISRLLLFVLAFLMPLKLESNRHFQGLALYILGLLLYFSSWILLIFFPFSAWSTSLPGFMAPAYTPIVWLLGISMIGSTYHYKLPFKRWHFPTCSIVFLLFHNFHTFLLF